MVHRKIASIVLLFGYLNSSEMEIDDREVNFQKGKKLKNLNITIKKSLLDSAIPIKDVQKIVLAYLHTWQNKITTLLHSNYFTDKRITSLVFSKNGKYLISCGKHDRDLDLSSGPQNSIISLWNIKQGMPEKSIANTKGREIIASAEGRYFACLEDVSKIKIFDFMTLKPLSAISHTGSVCPTSLCFSPNSEYIAATASSSTSASLTIYDTKTGLEAKRLEPKIFYEIGQFSAIAFDREGKKIFKIQFESGPPYSATGPFLEIWDIEAGKVDIVYDYGDADQICFTANGKYFILKYRNKLTFHATQIPYEVIREYTSPGIKNFMVSSDSKYLFFVTREIIRKRDKKQFAKIVYVTHVLDLLTFNEIDKFSVTGELLSDSEPADITFSLNGIYIAQATTNNNIEIFSNQALEIENTDPEEIQNNVNNCSINSATLINHESSSDCTIM